MSEFNKPEKPVHTLVLDAGPLIRNAPPVSTLLAQSHSLVTTPTVISEIRDPSARARIETLYIPFLTQRSPKPESLRFVSEFARKTGDRAVLSRTDLEIIALAYEVECERNGGDWRLRRDPAQKGINGIPPTTRTGEKRDGDKTSEGTSNEEATRGEEGSVQEISKNIASTTIEDNGNEANVQQDTAETTETGTTEIDNQDEDTAQEDESDQDDGGWITPSNLKKRQAKDEGSASPITETKTMQAATITTDFAMQNVLLRMNLNILSDNTLQRIRHLKSYILRCHGCFSTTKDMSKQFCPRCGQPTLTRVSCTTSASGEFKLHLKKNKQFNNRGERYSIPKPTSGSANGKWKGGGGQSGWGTGLILAEDQKEYVRAVTDEGRRQKKERDLMDADYLPNILTGERHKSGGRIKVGAGRNVNSRRRR